MSRGPRWGAEGRKPYPKAKAHLLIALVAVLVYAALQLPMPTHSGPDAAYYLLGCEQLDLGQWPWGAEPPLAFLVLYPFTRVLAGPQAFTVCSALLGGLAVFLMGELCTLLAGNGGTPSRKPPAAAALGAILCLGYMSPWFMTGLLKNQVANVFVIAVLMALATGNPLRCGLFLVLAAAAHPGIALTLLAAIAATAALSLGGRALAALRNGLDVRLAARRLLVAVRGKGLLLLAIGLLVVLGAGLAAPTIVRYLSSYLRPDAPAESAAVFDWDAVAVLARYLPLWLPAAVAVVRAVTATAAGSSQRRSTAPYVVLSVWVIVLGAMASVSGLTSRRFEVQLFAPLVALVGAEMSHWIGDMRATGLGQSLGRKAMLLVAPLFGLVLAAATMAGAKPLLDASQVAALASFDATLPGDARIVVYQSDARYWVEYYARRPVLSPYLARERLDSPGPVYLFSEKTTTYGMQWPAETLAGLAARGLTVVDENGLLLFEAKWNQAFFDNWRDPRENEAVIALLDVEVPEGFHERGRQPPVDGKIAGWAFFLPLGLARAAGLRPAFAAAIGLPLTVSLWWCAACVALRRRSRQVRESAAGAAVNS